MTEETNAWTTYERPHRPLIRSVEKRNMTALPKMLLVSALLAFSTPSFADDAHHTNDTATPLPAAASPITGGQPGMMGPDMMPGGMMGPGMMSMMGPMMRMMSPKHIEGRLAFLETEFRITEAQRPLWGAFADALRANARDMAGMMKGMQDATPSQAASSAGLLQQIDLHERMLVTRLEALRRMKAALQPLYAALDDAQKRMADDLLAPSPMGFM
jgi:LTXXQ motif family protein